MIMKGCQKQCKTCVFRYCYIDTVILISTNQNWLQINRGELIFFHRNTTVL